MRATFLNLFRGSVSGKQFIDHATVFTYCLNAAGISNFSKNMLVDE
jgi:hypothetical protein